MLITATPMTPEAFSPYGHLARHGDGEIKSIRDGSVLLTKTSARCAHHDGAEQFSFDFYEAAPVSAPLQLGQAEKHPLSSQIFVPLNATRYLVIVWPEPPIRGGPPEAFVAHGQDVVIYHPGVWHHGIVALDSKTIFASAMWKCPDGEGDTIFQTLNDDHSVTWSAGMA